MRIFGRSKKSGVSKNKPESARSSPKQRKQAQRARGDEVDDDDDDASSSYSCRFSTDHTYSSNQTPPDAHLADRSNNNNNNKKRPMTIVSLKLIKKNKNKGVVPRQVVAEEEDAPLIDSPPRLERTNRRAAASITPASGTTRSTTKAPSAKQQPSPAAASSSGVVSSSKYSKSSSAAAASKRSSSSTHKSNTKKNKNQKNKAPPRDRHAARLGSFVLLPAPPAAGEHGTPASGSLSSLSNGGVAGGGEVGASTPISSTSPSTLASSSASRDPGVAASISGSTTLIHNNRSSSNNNVDLSVLKWFPGTVTLSVLEPRNREATLQRAHSESWNFLLTPAPERMVRQSCLRHLRLAHDDNNSNATACLLAPPEEQALPAAAVDVDAYDLFLHKPPRTADDDADDKYTSKETNSVILHDYSKAAQLVHEFVHVGNLGGAIAIGKILLQHQQQRQKRGGSNSNASAAITIIARQLALLCLAAGRAREAADYCARAQRASAVAATSIRASSAATDVVVADSSGSQRRRTSGTTPEAVAPSPEGVNIMIELGLIQFGTNKVGQATKTWREAIHMAIAVHGYQEKTVAVLLNCLGVAYMESRDGKSSLRSLEESVELQRSILRSSGSTLASQEPASSESNASTHSSAFVVDDAIFGMAVTMSNLATACERDEQYDRAISLLEESMALFESSSVNTADLEELVRKTLEHLDAVRDRREADLDTEDPTVYYDDDELEYSEYISDDEDDIAGSVGGGDDEDDGGALQCTRNVSRVSSMDNSGFSQGGSFSPVRSKSSSNSSTASHGFMEEDDENNDCDASIDSGRSNSLFGNPDGIPSRKLAAKLTMEQRDNHDYLLLGSLSPELTCEQRVRETVMTWFGRRIDGELDSVGKSRAPIITFDLEEIEVDDESLKQQDLSSEVRSMLDLDEGAVQNADQHLKEIHMACMKHLDDDRVDEALALIQQAMLSHKTKYGENHHLVGSALHNMGMVNFFAKRYDEGLKLFQEAIRVRTKALGPDHPDVQASRTKIALIHLATGKLDKAHNTFRQVCDKYVDVLGYGHIQLAKIHNNIGVVAYECGDQEQAMKCFEMAFDFQHRLLEKQDECESPDDHEVVSLATAHSLTNMAFVYAKREEYTQSMELYEHAFELLRMHLPRKHHRVKDVRLNLEYLVRTCGVEMTENSSEGDLQEEEFVSDDAKMQRTCCGAEHFSSCFR